MCVAHDKSVVSHSEFWYTRNEDKILLTTAMGSILSIGWWSFPALRSCVISVTMY
jgi:hypothetical protein